MGRRRAKAMAAPKKRPTLAKRFKCPFCANENVVECKMDHKAGIGSLACRLCGASYQMNVHHLHEPIDVFSEWLDDCEAAEKANGVSTANVYPTHPREDDDDDDDDNLLAPSGLNVNKQRGEVTQVDSDDGVGVGDEDSDDE